VDEPTDENEEDEEFSGGPRFRPWGFFRIDYKTDFK
jgi:hypothetical protein